MGSKAKTVDSIEDFKAILTAPSRFGDLTVIEVSEMNQLRRFLKRTLRAASSVIRSSKKIQECKCRELSRVEGERDIAKSALNNVLQQLRVYTGASSNVEALRRITK